MEFPYLNEISRSREVMTAFGGYNHQLSCPEGQFYDMENMTSDYYPILSPRKERSCNYPTITPQCLLSADDLYVIRDGSLMKNGEAVDLGEIVLSSSKQTTMTKMGAYIIIMPDKVWYNTETGECGSMELSFKFDYATKFGFACMNSRGEQIWPNEESYYEENEPQDGDYKLCIAENTTTGLNDYELKVYSKDTWIDYADTYMAFALAITNIPTEAEGTTYFADGDWVRFSVYPSESEFDEIKKIFGNFLEKETEDGWLYVDTEIKVFKKYSEDNKTFSTRFTFPGLTYCLNTFIQNGDDGESIPFKIKVERLVPEMSHVIECNNRLWGCSPDGHELYASKLGDMRNWNSFSGTSIASWTATVGSAGEFTGAITYQGYPIFFKEDSIIKVSISAYGAHQYKEVKCKGVQNGSDKSLAIVNEILYYKSHDCVCMYTGTSPASISAELGEEKYYDASAGALGDKYYISMSDKAGAAPLFVYDTTKRIWTKEHSDFFIIRFCNHKDELFMIGGGCYNSVNGTFLPGDSNAPEGPVDWFVESGTIGYNTPDNKYVTRLNLGISLEFGTSVDFYIQYDSFGEWEHKFNMAGTGTRTYTIPIIPRRCDHFKYKIVGKGGCKIYSIAKTLEQGSDINV